MLVFEFDKKNAQKAKNAIRKGFSANGMELTENGITLDDKIQKKGGFKFQTVYVMFKDKQSAVLNVKLSQHKKDGTDKEETAGDVFEVKISTAPGKYKVLPIKNQDDHEKAIAEIAKALVANRKKFEKASEAVKVTIPKLKGVSVSHKQRVEALKAQIADIDTQIAAVDKKIESQKEVLAEAVRQAVAKKAKEVADVAAQDVRPASGEGMPGKSDGDYSDADSLAAKNTDNKSALANAIREKIASRSISSYEAKMAALALPYAKDEEVVTVKNQDIDVKQAVNEWLGKQPDVARNFIYGEGEKEKHTNHRMARIMEAYDAGEQDQLPPIRFEPQFGGVSDGRHRLAAAYLRGEKTIKADLVFDLSRYLDGHWSNNTQGDSHVSQESATTESKDSGNPISFDSVVAAGNALIKSAGLEFESGVQDIKKRIKEIEQNPIIPPDFAKKIEAIQNSQEITITRGKIADRKKWIKESTDPASIKACEQEIKDYSKKLKKLNKSAEESIARLYKKTPSEELDVLRNRLSELRVKNFESGKKIIDVLISSSSISDEEANNFSESVEVTKAATRNLKTYANGTEDLRKQVAMFHKVTNGALSHFQSVKFDYNGDKRANAYNGITYAEINLDNSGFELNEAIWHELGHAVEFANKDILASSLEFMKNRRYNGKVVTLNSVSGGGYGWHEKVWDGDFISPYIGKIYLKNEDYYFDDDGKMLKSIELTPDMIRSTEVISMGIERLATPEAAGKFAAQDPEMFAFIVGICAKGKKK